MLPIVAYRKVEVCSSSTTIVYHQLYFEPNTYPVLLPFSAKLVASS